MSNRLYSFLLLILFVSCSKDTTTISAQSSIVGSTSLVPTTNKGYLIQHTYFTLSYSETNRQAEWVAYNLPLPLLMGHKRGLMILE
jgi:DNA/RNA endonuclease G (NUC1)